MNWSYDVLIDTALAAGPSSSQFRNLFPEHNSHILLLLTLYTMLLDCQVKWRYHILIQQPSSKKRCVAVKQFMNSQSSCDFLFHEMRLTFLVSEMTGFSHVYMKMTFQRFKGFINVMNQETSEDKRDGLVCEYFVSAPLTVVT